jgi:hypothetical protein
MLNTNFIHIDVLGELDAKRQYFNINHIVRVYFKDNHVYIETSDYCSYKTTETSIDVFMDRFIRYKENNILKG